MSAPLIAFRYAPRGGPRRHQRVECGNPRALARGRPPESPGEFRGIRAGGRSGGVHARFGGYTGPRLSAGGTGPGTGLHSRPVDQARDFANASGQGVARTLGNTKTWGFAPGI